MKTYDKRQYLFTVVLVAILWGSAYPIVRFLVAGGVDPYLVVGMRILLTFSFSGLMLLCSRKKLNFPLYRKNFLPFFLMSLTGTVGFSFFMTYGLEFSTATKSSIVIGSNPILVVLFSYLLFREPLGLRKALGVVVAIAGVFLAVAGWDIFYGEGLAFGSGDLLLVAGAVFWAAYTLLNRHFGHRMDQNEGLFWIFGLGTVLALPLLLPRLHLLAELSGLQWFWLFFCGFIPGGLCYFLWNRSLSVLGASTCSICASFMPASSVILAVLFLGEPLVWTQIAGTVMVIGGVLLGLIHSPLPVNYETGQSLTDTEKDNER